LPVLTVPVQYYAGPTILSATSAVIDIDQEHNTFVLSTIDGQGNRIQQLLSSPINEVVAKGSGTRVRFNMNGTRKWVDFSMGASMIMMAGIAGQIAGGVMNKNSGVAEVVAALRAGGANVRYWSYWKRFGLALAIAGAIVVVFIVISIVASLGNP